MVGRFREGQVQLPLADEDLEILIPKGVWLAVHQLRQAAQREESPLAELQQHIDQHLAFHLALGSGLRGQPFQSRAERLGESLQIIDHRQRQLLRDQAAVLVSLFGQIRGAGFQIRGAEHRNSGFRPKNVVRTRDGIPGQVVDRTPPTRGLQQAGLGKVLESFREIERVYGFDEAHGADRWRFDEIQAQNGSSRKSRHGSRHGVAIASWVATWGAYRDTAS